MEKIINLETRRKLIKHNQEIANQEAIYFLLQMHLKSIPALKDVYMTTLDDKIATIEYLESMLSSVGLLYARLNHQINEEMSDAPQIS